MGYDYSSESKRLELPNPYRLQNLWLWLCAALLAGGGVLCLWWSREALQAQSLRLVLAPLLAGLALLVGGLLAAGVAARRLRFFFGRGRPASLAPELAAGTTGGSPRADIYKDMLRQGGLTYPEPQGALDGVLYHAVPRLITAPLAVQALAQRHFFNLVAILATTLSFAVSWLLLGNDSSRPWIGMLYFVFGVFFLLKPVLGDQRARLSMASVVGLVAAALLAPVLIGLVGSRLPSPGLFSLSAQTAIMLGTGLVAVCLVALAVLAQVGDQPSTQASGEQLKLSMNAPPNLLLDELDRQLQQGWTERIPNRRYARLEPVIDPGRSAGPFAGELMEETQPMPVGGTVAPTLSSALAHPPHRWLVALDVYATLLVATAVGLLLYFVREFDVGAAWQDKRLSLAGTSTLLLLVALFCFKAAQALWGRFNFESVLIWVELAGTWQRSRVGTGNTLTSRLNTDSEIVRTESMTLRVWRARIESVVFGKDDQRQVTAMFSTGMEAKDLAAHLAAFGRSQSVLVATGSEEDQARIAALNQGERALSGTPAAAQLHHDIRATAALGQAAPAAEPGAAAAPPAATGRFCSECGEPLSPGARFCAACGARVAPG
ncbi:zinc ribbon domain-containing protein [Aquabacterium sp. A7-Y]|uniref:zinc-ribbon domain-containing protein n=1 Tax=Aquabacterium sp. A7-Y TaxID=1349605 RepID=UPI00223C9C22|nr:zinc-ribbon domain-containing protein [Aquabacterium sp. A7-Y]MCW7536559.1 zinc ribbon domain-containing protein [Aquabacterium sp. A7-Y]